MTKTTDLLGATFQMAGGLLNLSEHSCRKTQLSVRTQRYAAGELALCVQEHAVGYGATMKSPFWVYLWIRKHNLHLRFPRGSPLQKDQVHKYMQAVRVPFDRVKQTLGTARTRVSAGVKGDCLAVNLETSFAASDVALVCAVYCVILEHVCGILRVAKGVVDGYDLDIRVLHRSTQDKSADAAESIDANLDLRPLNHRANAKQVDARCESVSRQVP